MSEIEKAKETIKWMEFFVIILNKVDTYAINHQTLKNGIKTEIDNMIKQCNQIIEGEELITKLQDGKHTEN